MTYWAQRARWIVAVAGVIFATAVFFAIRERERAASASIIPSDPRAEVEITGAISRQWRGPNENFTVKAERQLSYPDGSLKLVMATVYVDDRQGNRKFVATAREGEVGPNKDVMNLKGDVSLVSTDGIKVETGEASYNTAEGIVRAPGPGGFSRGRITGHGIGMTYDRNRDVLWLLEQATVSLTPDDKGAGRLEVTSGTAGLAGSEKYLRFERDVRIVRDNRTILADNSVGYLSEDESHLTSLELRGNSQIQMDHAASGSLQAMGARDINLTYSEDGELIERAVLAGGAAIQIAGPAGKPGRRIGAELLDVGLNAEGTAMTSLNGRENVRLDFPAEGDAPARSVRAGVLDGSAGDKKELTAARLTENVEYRELMGSPPTPRIVRANVLDLTFTPGMAGISEARFSGAVRFEENDLRATAATATYDVTRGVIDLLGAVRFEEDDLRATAATAKYDVTRGVIDLLGDPKNPPTVSNSEIRVTALRILLTTDGPKLEAKGSVTSELQPAKKEARGRQAQNAKGKGAADPQKLPSFLSEDQPVNVTADALNYDGVLSSAVYTGSATLWQGESAIKADTIAIDGASGNLKADGSVRSTLMVDDTDAKTKQTKTVATVAGAGALDYNDQARRAVYTTDARVNGPQGDLLARKIELYFGQDDNELQRVEGYEAVTLRDRGRSATGDRLSYFAADERYDMTGAPVRIVEGCQESAGRTLTFYKSVDRIIVDGQQRSRTRTKSGSDCPESSPTAPTSSGR